MKSTAPAAWRHIHMGGHDIFLGGGQSIDLGAVIQDSPCKKNKDSRGWQRGTSGAADIFGGLGRHPMQALRAALLAQHKVLIANDRQQYEAVFGPVPTGRFVQLLTEDAWFRWLDPLSRLIVALDEWLEQTPPQAGAGIALADEAAKLFRNADAEFGERYRLALQQAPDAVLGQSQVVAALRSVPQSPRDETGQTDQSEPTGAAVKQDPDALANKGNGA